MAMQWEQKKWTLPSGLWVYQLTVLPGPVWMETWQGLERLLSTLRPESDVAVLASSHMSIPPLGAAEQGDWVEAAGHYRRTQERFKAQGGRLFSMVTGRLVGGTYLVHGMGATWRYATPQTRVYPALEANVFERILGRPYPHPTSTQQALDSGIITGIIEPEALQSMIETTLRLTPPAI